jgi:hypothetical protein
MGKRKMIITTKQCGAYTTHCQLHGEPTEHPAYTHCKFVIDGQKVKHFNLHEGATNRQVLEALSMMELNINDFDYQFVRWENFSLLNKALVMPALPIGLIEGSNCDDNFKAGWIACWNAIKGQ